MVITITAQWDKHNKTAHVLILLIPLQRAGSSTVHAQTEEMELQPRTLHSYQVNHVKAVDPHITVVLLHHHHNKTTMLPNAIHQTALALMFRLEVENTHLTAHAKLQLTP